MCKRCNHQEHLDEIDLMLIGANAKGNRLAPFKGILEAIAESIREKDHIQKECIIIINIIKDANK